LTPTERLRNFGFLMRDVTRLFTKSFEAHTQSLGLTLPQCKIVGYLSRNEGITQTRLAELTDTDPMSLVRALDRMEQDGWLERRPDPTDRRAYHLYLLEPAKQLLARMWKYGDQARNEALSDLDAQEREQLIALLERIHTTLAAKYGK
jgi:MarR family transcriptional regulator, transcriptional regulator for hemolysin